MSSSASAQRPLDGRDRVRVVDPPEPVHGAVVVGHLAERRRLGRRLDRAPRGACGIGVQAEDRREVRARRARQAQAVLARARVRALVGADPAGAVVLDADAGEEARGGCAARRPGPCSPARAPRSRAPRRGRSRPRPASARAARPRARRGRRPRSRPRAGRSRPRCRASARASSARCSGSITSYGGATTAGERPRPGRVVVQGTERLDVGHGGDRRYRSAACRPVRHPVPFWSDGAWRSLVAHLLWEQEVAGSNPGAPIAKARSQRRFYLSPRGSQRACVPRLCSPRIAVGRSGNVKTRPRPPLQRASRTASPDGGSVCGTSQSPLPAVDRGAATARRRPARAASSSGAHEIPRI